MSEPHDTLILRVMSFFLFLFSLNSNSVAFYNQFILEVFVIFSLLVGLTIFTGEKIQDLTPLAANTVLILGQGNMLFLHLYYFASLPTEIVALPRTDDLLNQVFHTL